VLKHRAPLARGSIFLPNKMDDGFYAVYMSDLI